MRESIINISQNFLRNITYHYLKDRNLRRFSGNIERLCDEEDNLIYLDNNIIDENEFIRFFEDIEDRDYPVFTPVNKDDYRCYFLWDDLSKVDIKNTVIIQPKDYYDLWSKFSENDWLIFSEKQINNSKNRIKSWNDGIIRKLMVSKTLVIYDKYIFNKDEYVENNLIKLLTNYSFLKRIFVFIVTCKEKDKNKVNINDKIKKIKSILNNIEIQICVLKYSYDKLDSDRYIFTDYFYIDSNHSSQAVTKRGINETKLNFSPLIKKENRNIYYQKIEDIIKLVNDIDNINGNVLKNEKLNIEYQNSLIGDIDSKEQLIEKLRSL